MTPQKNQLEWPRCIATVLTFGTLACSSPLLEGPGQTQSADGTPIHYSVYGRGATPLVFVHGWACDQTYWTDQVTALAGEFTVVTIDLAGHGLSGDMRQDWSIASFANDVVAVLGALDLRGAVLIGHSLGGPIVLEAAAAVPHRIAAVIGADTFHDIFAAGPYEPLLEAMRIDFRAASEPFIRSAFVEASPPALVRRILEDMLSQDPESGIAALEALQAWGPARMERALSQAMVPLGVIQTTEFRNASSIVEASLGTSSSTRIVEMDGVGHFLMSEDPIRFNEALRSLVAELTEPGEVSGRLSGDDSTQLWASSSEGSKAALGPAGRQTGFGWVVWPEIRAGVRDQRDMVPQYAGFASVEMGLERLDTLRAMIGVCTQGAQSKWS